ncbi:hypothetical protein QLX08_000416 [Tetragonisca angustula]|uniref:Uncharacterized protein n=1 Tax=Tetragonisca angustula TaxID=166442 RepID=A0AAW1AK49_9HYME
MKNQSGIFTRRVPTRSGNSEIEDSPLESKFHKHSVKVSAEFEDQTLLSTARRANRENVQCGDSVAREMRDVRRTVEAGWLLLNCNETAGAAL